MMPDRIKLHPEFTGSAADVTLVAGSVGFRVNRAMLGMASPAFAKLVRASDLSAGIVDTGDEPGELYAFLKLMRIGPGRPAASAATSSSAASTAEDKENRDPDKRQPPEHGYKRDKEKGSGSLAMDGDTAGSRGKEPLAESAAAQNGTPGALDTATAPPPVRPRILVSRPGTGVKALDRALREAQAKATGARKKKPRVRFQDQHAASSPVPPPLPLPPSHPFNTPVTSPRPRPRRSRSNSSTSSNGGGGARSRSNSASSQATSAVSPPHAHAPPEGAQPRPEDASPPSPSPPSPANSSVPTTPPVPCKHPARSRSPVPHPARSAPSPSNPAPPSPPRGTPASGPPAAFAPSIPQLLQIHRLTQKYPGFYTQAILDFHIELNSAALVRSLGAAPRQLELFRLLELAHALRSSKLWSLVLAKLAGDAHWRAMLDPWGFGELEARALGHDVFSILAILGAIHVDPPGGDGRAGKGRDGKGPGGDGAYSQVDKVCVMYDEGELCDLATADNRGAGVHRHLGASVRVRAVGPAVMSCVGSAGSVWDVSIAIGRCVSFWHTDPFRTLGILQTYFEQTTLPQRLPLTTWMISSITYEPVWLIMLPAARRTPSCA